MNVRGSRPSRRLRRRCSPTTIAACCCVALATLCHPARAATPFLCNGRYSIALRWGSAGFDVRGGGGEATDTDAMHLQASSTSATPAIPVRAAAYASDGSWSSRRGLWKRIRVIRGGVEGGEAGNDTKEEEDATNTTSNINDISPPADEDRSPNAHREGGVLSSFFSFFRAPAAADTNGSNEKKAINTSDIAHKIPHGPDGRGGGSVVATLPPQSTEDPQQQQIEGEHVLTSEVTDFVTDATAAGKVELAKTLSSVYDGNGKPTVSAGVDSTAFVVPPAHNPLSSIDRGEKEGAKTKKSSKGKTTIKEVEHTKSMNTSSTTEGNETDSITASNATMGTNATESLGRNISGSNETGADVRLQPRDFTSSGYWVGIDLVASLGLSSFYEDLKLSRALRPVRKAAARATGLHGFVSGKEYTQLLEEKRPRRTSTVITIDEELGIHDANALEAEMLARRVANRKRRRNQDARTRGNNRPGRRWGFRRGQGPNQRGKFDAKYVVVPALDPSPDALDYRRRKRVEEIDRLLQRGGERLLELQCERDDLLQAPNPLFNYTKKTYDPSTNQTFGDVRTTREFNFPSPELVNEYISELVSNGRLHRMNHTELWQSRSDNDLDDDDEIVGDDLLTPSLDARKLYEDLDELERGNRNGNKNKGGGSWLLRGSLGEKLGETIEIAAYKGVCSAVMMVFARMLSALHGVNVLSHSDIRTYIEEDPDLPPVDKKHGPLLNGDKANYAQDAIKTALQKGAKKKRKTGKHGSHKSSHRRHGHELSDDAFIQRDAVVETLISHCQISAPLLKLFPLDWQRAMVGNIITLATAIVSDFADGLQVQILGHSLTVSFKPITEADMIQHIGVGSFRQNHRRTRPDEFEAAVLATALDLSESLTFLDGWLEWFERKLGGGVLRSQIGNLIARVVLTLIDEVLSGARMDLWSSQANGPRLYAALEYRTSSKEDDEEEYQHT